MNFIWNEKEERYRNTILYWVFDKYGEITEQVIFGLVLATPLVVIGLIIGLSISVWLVGGTIFFISWLLAALNVRSPL